MAPLSVAVAGPIRHRSDRRPPDAARRLHIRVPSARLLSEVDDRTPSQVTEEEARAIGARYGLR